MCFQYCTDLFYNHSNKTLISSNMSSKAYFSDIKSILQKQLSASFETINVAISWLTDRDLIKELTNKAKEGVTVIVIINDDEINNYSNSRLLKELEIAGAEILLIKNQENNLMHNKFCIIDNSTLVTGSYNWTNNATNNSENIVIIKGEQKLIEEYNNEFRSIYNSIKSHIKPILIRQSFDNIEIVDESEIDRHFTKNLDRYLYKFCNKYELERNVEDYLFDKQIEVYESVTIKVNDEDLIMTVIISGKYKFNQFENSFESPYEIYDEDELLLIESEDGNEEIEEESDPNIDYENDFDLMEVRKLIMPELENLPQLWIAIVTDKDFGGFEEYKKLIRKNSNNEITSGYFEDNLDFAPGIKYYLKNNLLETCCSSEFNLLKIGTLEVNSYIDYDNGELDLKNELFKIDANIYLSIRNCSYISERNKIKPFRKIKFKKIHDVETLKKDFLEFCIEKINLTTIYPYDLKYYFGSIYDTIKDIDKYEYSDLVIISGNKYRFKGRIIISDYENDETMFPSQIVDSFGKYDADIGWSFKDKLKRVKWEWNIDQLIENIAFEDAINTYLTDHRMKEHNIEYLKICEVVSSKIHFWFIIKLERIKN